MNDPIGSRAGLDFVLALRRRWADTVYPCLRREYDAAPAGDLPETGRDTCPVTAPADEPRARAAAAVRVAPRVHALPSYPWFAWLERGSQKMLWRAVDDALPAAPPADGDPSPARVRLDPALALPAWYAEWDIHLQPGGVWSSPRSGAVYELGAQLVMLGDNDDYKFHRLFVETALPPRRYRRIVDLGCGFGKSTWPLKRAFPDAEVVGVDLAAPCLTLAATRAGRQGLAIEFVQANAAATGLESGSADLVTSTMLVHELPLDVLAGVLAECRRLLAPGGVLRFFDFHLTGDPLRDLAMLEHGARNNEPFMPPTLSTDLAAMAEAAGLAHVHWVAFDERAGGRLDGLGWPVRPEWHFPWAVLEAEAP